jgi:hypothetical protein
VETYLIMSLAIKWGSKTGTILAATIEETASFPASSFH